MLADRSDAAACAETRALYQPVVDIRSGVVTSCEVLLHRRRPPTSPVEPSETGPASDAIEPGAPLERRILAQACKDAAAWPDSIRVSVDVSSMILDGGLERAVAEALEGADLLPRRLQLEVTPHGTGPASEAASLDVLRRLKASGVAIALDEFGTDRFSLSCLRRFEFDEIKIDRSLVRDIAATDAATIIRAIASIGARLGIATVADGVETEEQGVIVRQEGCTQIQGPLVSPLLRAEEVRSFIGRQGVPASGHVPPAANRQASAFGKPALSRRVQGARIRLGWSHATLARESHVELASVYLLERFGTAGDEVDAAVTAALDRHAG